MSSAGGLPLAAASPKVALPEAFPTPVILLASVGRRIRVDASGEQHEVTVLGPETDSLERNYYEITRVIRTAIFGSVHHAVRLLPQEDGTFRYELPHREFAIKVYNRSRLRDLQGSTQENPLVEIAAMQTLSAHGEHPHVMSLVECTMDLEHVFSVMEFCDGGELYEVVDELEGPLEEADARHYIMQIVRGLQHIHSLGIGHRDLSLENVLLQRATNTCKIIDFGMCLKMQQEPQAEAAAGGAGGGATFASVFGHPRPQYCNIPPQGVCGKKNYIAPEVLCNEQPFSPIKVDVWALGIILFIMLTGYPPFEYAMDVDQRFRIVKAGQLPALLRSWGTRISPEGVDLLHRILKVVPSERPELEAILGHRWFGISLPSRAAGQGGGGRA